MTVFQAAGLEPLKVRLGALGGWPLIEPAWSDEGFLWSLDNFLKNWKHPFKRQARILGKNAEEQLQPNQIDAPGCHGRP